MTFSNADQIASSDSLSVDLLVGKRLRELRVRKGYSLRELANHSGLSINTLSLIENGKSSPSVSTLQQLALALTVPIAVFFETEPVAKKIVFTPADQRPQATFGKTRMENLGKDLADHVVQPFVITLSAGKSSGDRMIVHTGHELVYCLKGVIHYQVGDDQFDLRSGDSLVFEAHLPHRWTNDSKESAQFLLILHPSDDREEFGGPHFSIEALKKEISMKIAAITEDGKNISQHFGRAPYYLVLTIEEGKITDREMRNKLGHGQFQEQAHAAESHGAGHGMDAQSHDKHVSMAQTISDCKALLCGGMGMGAYESMRRLNIQPVVTDISDIETAVQAFIDGKLVDHTELLH